MPEQPESWNRARPDDPWTRCLTCREAPCQCEPDPDDVDPWGRTKPTDAELDEWAAEWSAVFGEPMT